MSTVDDNDRIPGRRLRDGHLNIGTVQVRVKQVAEAAIPDAVGTIDVERAHMLEDDLFQDVLIAIANGHRHPQTLAREALKSQKINFSRFGA